MKILSLNNYHYLRGGSERYFLDHRALFESKGDRVVTFSTASEQNESLSSDSVLVPAIDVTRPRRVDIGRFLYSSRGRSLLEALLSRTRPDIAHLHIYYGQLTASILKPLRNSGIPLVQTLHDYKLYCPVSTFFRDDRPCDACAPRAFWKAVRGRCNRKSFSRSLVSSIETYLSHWLGAEQSIDQFLTVSDFQRRKLIALGLPPAKVATIHNFKDVSHIRPSHTPGSHFLYFGRLERAKGLYTLLDAVTDLTGYRTIIAGEGSARPELERIVKSRNLDHVSLVGFKSGAALNQLIRDSICTVLPSECWETFGLTTLESFALGRPVVASNIGGIPEVITHGLDGFLVEPGNAEELRERLLWLAGNRKLAVDMGMAGRRTVERRFDPTSHYRKLTGIYQRLLNA